VCRPDLVAATKKRSRAILEFVSFPSGPPFKGAVVLDLNQWPTSYDRSLRRSNNAQVGKRGRAFPAPSWVLPGRILVPNESMKRIQTPSSFFQFFSTVSLRVSGEGGCEQAKPVCHNLVPFALSGSPAEKRFNGGQHSAIHGASATPISGFARKSLPFLGENTKRRSSESGRIEIPISVCLVLRTGNG